ELVTEWSTLSPQEQGERSGYIFGKYGTDIVAPGAIGKLLSKGTKVLKEVAAVRSPLVMAERTLVFETISQSSARLPVNVSDNLSGIVKVLDGNSLGVGLENSITRIMGDSYKAVGEVTASIKNEELRNFLNTLSEGNWVKVYEAGVKNGNRMEVHYFRNNTTGNIFDPKVKYDCFHQKEFKELMK
ncbi:MAG: hypothetical protein JSS09_03240, partial [Verrucomicrobia bacterium]|nr:hypothetical protein [Verrucomicrobiota bacterium]